MIMNNLTSQECTHDNDVYKKFLLLASDGKVNSLNTQMIYPADEGIIGKYSKADYIIIKETPEYYQNKSLKFIESLPNSRKQWVWNIIDNGAEKEKVIYRDEDPESGFLLVIDYGMSAEQKESLHILAIVERKDLLSLRDCGARELPLLRKIRDASLKVIPEKFGVPVENLRLHFHYHPSFYHLHIHVTHSNMEGHSLRAERSVLLESVIQNIEFVPDYYQKATLEFCLRTMDPMYKFLYPKKD